VPNPDIEIGNLYLDKNNKNAPPPSSPEDFQVFRSRQLVALIAAGRAFNLDVSAAIARIQQAEAQVRINFQPLIPTIEAEGTGNQSLTHVRGQALKTTNVTAQLTASYEIDFWGKNRAAYYSAKASEYVSSFDAANILIQTDASVASNYFQAVATKKELDIARQNLAIAQRTLEAIKARNKVGTASGLDVAQQETLVANVKVTIPPLEQNYRQFRNALAVLVGKPPELFDLQSEDLFAIRVPAIEPGLPSDLLCRRPDIAEAEARLSAARFTVSSARAALFPTIQLTGNGGVASTALSSLFSPQNLFYNATVGITQPITNLYQLRAVLDQDQARYAELLENYRSAIISAFRDVENALIAYQKTAEQERLQNMAVVSARRAFQISEAQLKGGVIDLTTLLQVEQTLFTAESALAQVRLNRLQAANSLYQALGGGWARPADSKIAEVPSVVEVKAKAQ
jgi:NodT family efflux transporter outer membrane factor (OMF) lipoprotein